MFELSADGSVGVSDEIRERVKTLHWHFPRYSEIAIMEKRMPEWFGPIPSAEDREIAAILDQTREQLRKVMRRRQAVGPA